MSKIKTGTVREKTAYICPSIACFTVEFSLCAGSLGGGHEDAIGGGSWEEEDNASGDDEWTEES